MLDRSAMHCIPQWTTLNDINSGMHTKRLDALFFPSDIQIACAKCFASSFMIQADAAFRASVQKKYLWFQLLV